MVSLLASPQRGWNSFPTPQSMHSLLLCDDEAMGAAVATDVEIVFQNAPVRRALGRNPDAQYISDYDLVFVQCDQRVAQALETLNALAEQPITARPAVIVQCSLETVDDLFAIAELLEADLLIGPDAAERIVVLTALARRTGLREEGDETATELRRLSEQIASFSEQIGQVREALSGLADSNGSGDGNGRRLASPSQTFAPPNQDYSAGLPSRKDKAVAASQVRQIIAHRRMRDTFFASDLFADPAWDILLDLYAAHLEEVPVSVSSLCIAAAVPPTTALRWVKLMTRSGLLERQPDRDDRRRVHVVLADQAIAAMVGFFGKTNGNGNAQNGTLLPGI